MSREGLSFYCLRKSDEGAVTDEIEKFFAGLRVGEIDEPMFSLLVALQLHQGIVHMSITTETSHFHSSNSQLSNSNIINSIVNWHFQDRNIVAKFNNQYCVNRTIH